MNNNNLISLKDRTEEEKREIARKGGEAKAKKDRDRKTLKRGLEIAETTDFLNNVNCGLEEQEEAHNLDHVLTRLVPIMNDSNPKTQLEAIRLYTELMGLDRESQIKREEIEAKKEIAFKELEIKYANIELEKEKLKLEKEKLKSKHKEKIVNDCID